MKITFTNIYNSFENSTALIIFGLFINVNFLLKQSALKTATMIAGTASIYCLAKTKITNNLDNHDTEVFITTSILTAMHLVHDTFSGEIHNYDDCE
jgi:hypothetical protein